VPTRTLYELTPSQQLSILNRHWTLHKSIVNIATSVTIHERLDTAVLCQAVRVCVLRWDSFGLRFVKEHGEYRQYFGPRDCLYVEQHDFASAAEQERLFAERAARRIPLAHAPQAGFIVFTTPEGHTGIFSVISHLIMDAWAIAAFYRDVVDVYAAIVAGESLPKPPRDHEPVLQRELEYLRSGRSEADRAFWQAEFSGSEPQFTSLKGSTPLERYRRITRHPDARQCWTQHLRTKADHVVLVVDAADVRAFQAFLDREHLSSMQALFVMGLRLYLAKVNGRAEDITLGVNVARRATLVEKNSGGCRVQNLTLRIVMPESMTFREAVEAVVEKQDTLFRHADFSSMEMLNLPHELYRDQGSVPGTGYYDVLLTFQPVPLSVGHGYTCTTDWTCNGAFSLPGYLTVMDDDGSGGLRCYWERQVHYLPVSLIQDCHAFMVRALRAGVANPSVTLGELMDL